MCIDTFIRTGDIPIAITSVMSHKNVTKVVGYILIQLSALNNTGSKVSARPGATPYLLFNHDF
jgi:hypothetical protein